MTREEWKDFDTFAKYVPMGLNDVIEVEDKERLIDAIYDYESRTCENYKKERKQDMKQREKKRSLYKKYHGGKRAY